MIEDDPRIDPAALRTVKFPGSSRRYDARAVDEFLRNVSERVAATNALVDDLERRLRVAEATEAAPSRAAVDLSSLSDDELLQLVGDETATVLGSARKAAADIRSKAEEAAGRLIRESTTEARTLVEDAEGVAAQLRAEATNAREIAFDAAERDAERLRQDASRDATRTIAEAREAAHAELASVEGRKAAAQDEAAQILVEAREEGRAMVAEAKDVRGRILDDLQRRRDAARLQIERLVEGRDRLLAAYGTVRGTLDDTMRTLEDAAPTAERERDAGPVGTVGTPEHASDTGGLAMGAATDEGSAADAITALAEGESPVAATDALAAQPGVEDVADDTIADDTVALDAVVDESMADGTGPGDAVADDTFARDSGVEVPVDDTTGDATDDSAPANIAVDPNADDTVAVAGDTVVDDTVVGDAVVGDAVLDETVAVLDDTVADVPEAGSVGSDGPVPVEAVRAEAGDETTPNPDETIVGDAEVRSDTAATESVASDGPVAGADDDAGDGDAPTDEAELAAIDEATVGVVAGAPVDVDDEATVPTATSAEVLAEDEGPDTIVDLVDDPRVDPVADEADDPGADAPVDGVDALFARLKAERAASVADAQRVLEGTGEADGDDPRTSEPGQAAGATMVTTAPERESEVDDALLAPSEALARRAEAIASVETGLTRAVKRRLADEQNIVLDLVRRGEANDVEALYGSATTHLESYRSVITAALGQVGDVAATGAGGAGSPEVAPLAAALAGALVEPFRRRVERAMETVEGDADALDERLRALYREWKVQRIGPAVEDALLSAYAAGTLAGTDAGRSLRWTIDPAQGPCPDAMDNALAGPTSAGDEYPTGDRCPQAHPGCRCLLVSG